MPRGDGTPYDTTDPMDDLQHGSHVAGIIAGEWNGFGISGATSGAEIMAVKITNDEDMMSISEALQGYRYVIAALEAGVDVVAINNSWNDSIYSKSLDMIMREAGRLGAVSVFAAGNDQRDIDMIGQVTNAFINNPYVVIVGNSDESGQIAESSNSGRRSVDVFAPGQDIYSTVPTDAGPADEAAAPLVAEGITYLCDYESTDVQDNSDDGAFTFTGVDGTTIALADDGHASARSLCLTAAESETLTVSLTSRELSVGSECRGLSVWVKAPAAKHMVCLLTYNTVDGKPQDERLDLTQVSEDWQVLTFPIAKNANKDSLGLEFSMSVLEWRASPDSTMLIDDVKLTSATIPYEYQTGTSMAAPAIAGSASVLAAAFPDDDAAKRAARIVGSVRHEDGLVDLCVSEGVFRLDKALEQDTNPVLNEASTQAGMVTIEGFFFGGGPGSITVDGQTLAVVSWSETRIVAQLPSDFSAGEKLVQVTTEAGKAGHQFFRIDTPRLLYQRLPLPGRALSGNPGDYTVTSSEFDESFYGTTPRALVGLGGRLYYLLETDDGGCTIFRYDIDGLTWERVYEGGYAPGGGACTWNGKILFVAGRLKENKTYLGLFDPDACTVEYHLYNDHCFERGCTLVNTGMGILLAGGSELRYGDTHESGIDAVRTVDPESFTVSAVTLPDDVSLADSWYASAYDEDGNGYLFCGTSTTGFYKFSFADGNVTCTVLEEESIIGEKGGDGHRALSASSDESVTVDQDGNMVAGPTKNGIIASGPVMTNDSGVVTADTYFVDWGNTQFKPTEKQMSVTKIYNIAGTTYRDRFYVIGASESEVGGWVFASHPVETFEQPGDVSESSNPPNPTEPADSGEGPSDDRRADAQLPNQSTPSKPSVSQTLPATKLPDTADALPSSAPFILMTLCAFCLIVAAYVVK